MSSRPLDVIKQETKTADRYHRRHRSRLSQTDTIDALDTIGGTYHHGGPYDATLASYNTRMKNSPVAAVRDSNLEALRATPNEYIKDSLERHVPLQGTATIPSGSVDLSGNVMEYEEGTDMMRDPTAGGGAYKRWDAPGITYHPDDLKGKSEPSYTIERDMKRRERLLQPAGIEMQPRKTRHSFSAGDDRANYILSGQEETSGNSSSSRLSQGLRRRFGSLRRKRDVLVS